MRRTSQGSRPDFLANADEVLLTSSQVLASTISDGSGLTTPTYLPGRPLVGADFGALGTSVDAACAPFLVRFGPF